jgi:hypothetical protein
MKKLKLIFLLTLSFIIVGCANTVKVFSDYDTSQEFGAYKSFAWSGDKPGLASGTYPVSALTKSKMRAAIEGELSARGFIMATNTNEADFLVSFTLGARDKITTRRKTEYQVDPNAWRWGRGYYPYYYSDAVIPVTTEVPYQFTEGSIAVDIFDREENRPVWHSSASKRLNKAELSGSNDKSIETAKALLEGFPPQ